MHTPLFLVHSDVDNSPVRTAMLMSMERERIKLLLGGVALLFAFGLIAFAVFVLRTPEIYLVDGGQRFVVLSRNLWGDYRIESGSMFAHGEWNVVMDRTTTGTALVFRSQSGEPPFVFSLTLRYEKEGTGPDWSFDLAAYGTSGRDSESLLKGALHRFDDHAVLDYYDLALATDPRADVSTASAGLLEIAGRLVQSHPGDLYVRVLYLDALIRGRNTKDLADKLGQWKPDFEESGMPLLIRQFRLARASLDSRGLSDAGMNGFDRLSEITSPQHDLARRLKELPSLLDYSEGLYPVDTLVAPAPRVSFLEQQVAVKVARIAAELMLLQGERERALSILAGCYRQGQFYEREQFRMLRLIGAALRAIAAGGLANYVQNACDSTAEIDEAWRVLERLETVARKNRESTSGSVARLGWEEDDESTVRNAVSDARFELVRMCAAARRHLLSDRDLPTSAGGFAPLLPKGPPADPFSSGPLRFVRRDDLLACYSVGPDVVDQQAKIDYDPTNGTVSPGDIVTTVPTLRAIPFPREPVRADTRADFMRQFPNGLPSDPFADIRGWPYSVSDSTPVCVYSYGPDTNQREITPLEPKYVPSVQYDPTNGTVSPGDIFITIPPVSR